MLVKPKMPMLSSITKPDGSNGFAQTGPKNVCTGVTPHELHTRIIGTCAGTASVWLLTLITMKLEARVTAMRRANRLALTPVGRPPGVVAATVIAPPAMPEVTNVRAWPLRSVRTGLVVDSVAEPVTLKFTATPTRGT